MSGDSPSWVCFSRLVVGRTARMSAVLRWSGAGCQHNHSGEHSINTAQLHHIPLWPNWGARVAGWDRSQHWKENHLTLHQGACSAVAHCALSRRSTEASYNFSSNYPRAQEIRGISLRGQPSLHVPVDAAHAHTGYYRVPGETLCNIPHLVRGFHPNNGKPRGCCIILWYMEYKPLGIRSYSSLINSFGTLIAIWTGRDA